MGHQVHQDLQDNPVLLEHQVNQDFQEYRVRKDHRDRHLKDLLGPLVLLELRTLQQHPKLCLDNQDHRVRPEFRELRELQDLPDHPVQLDPPEYLGPIKQLQDQSRVHLDRLDRRVCQDLKDLQDHRVREDPTDSQELMAIEEQTDYPVEKDYLDLLVLPDDLGHLDLLDHQVQTEIADLRDPSDHLDQLVRLDVVVKAEE